MPLITSFARPVGERQLERFDFIFTGGLSDVGVDSAELLIGDNEGMWFWVGNVNDKFGGGDGVIDRDSWSLE